MAWMVMTGTGDAVMHGDEATCKRVAREKNAERRSLRAAEGRPVSPTDKFYASEDSNDSDDDED